MASTIYIECLKLWIIIQWASAISTKQDNENIEQGSGDMTLMNGTKQLKNIICSKVTEDIEKKFQC